MRNIVRYCLGPLWLFLGILMLVNGQIWPGFWSVIAGIFFGLGGIRTLKRRNTIVENGKLRGKG